MYAVMFVKQTKEFVRSFVRSFVRLQGEGGLFELEQLEALGAI